MRTKLTRVAGRVAGVAAGLTAAAALAVAAAPAASAGASHPDPEACFAEFRECPEQWDDPDWPPPAQYRAVGRDADAIAAMTEALSLVRTPCRNYDVLRTQLTQDGAIWEFTLTYTCD